MFSRAVSLTLMAAIIACPMWCGSGSCHAGQCCSAEQTSDRACSVHGTDCCCCEESLPDSDRHCPCESPRESSCQGVCGGAVFEKPRELNDVFDTFVTPLTDSESPVVARLIECNTQGVEHRWHPRGDNHGRSLRTLHMSFLC